MGRKKKKISKYVPAQKQSFWQRFSLVGPSLDSEKEKFLNRIENYLENLKLLHNLKFDVNNENFLYKLADKLGEKYFDETSINFYASRDFRKMLHFLEKFYELLPARTRTTFGGIIQETIEEAEIDIGIRFDVKDGLFWPSGAKFLDKGLVDETMMWLSQEGYDTVAKPFRNAWENYLETSGKKEQRKLQASINNSYEALEAFAKIVCGNDKDLSANREKLVKQLKLSKHFNKLLSNYVEYANDYRHGEKKGKKREIIKKNEVEAFLYLTGLVIRMGIYAP